MDKLEQGFDRSVEIVAEWAPQLLGALVIIVIGHFVATAISNAVRRLLMSLQLDARMQSAQGGAFINKVVPHPTRLLRRVTYWLVFVGALMLGATVLGIDTLNDLIYAIYGYVPRVISALLIFLIGSAIAAGVTSLVRNTMGDTTTGKMIESVAPVIVIGITLFMILDQLEVAPTIVTITYAALLGTVSLGTALAFGLGGRDVAARMLETTYQKSMENADQVKSDLARGKERAKAKASQARRRTQR